MKYRLFYTLAFLFLAGSLVSGMCAGVKFEKLLNSSDIVFQGKVIDITELYDLRTNYTDYVYTMDVSQLYKGDPVRIINITYYSDLVVMSNSKKSPVFSIGESRLVYAQYSENGFRTSNCEVPYDLSMAEQLDRLNKLVGNNTCVEKAGSCCKGDICAAANVICLEGTTPFFGGCDENCSPRMSCVNDSSVIGCQNLYWIDNENKNCGQKNFCGAYMYYGLKTFENKNECLNAINQTINCPFYSLPDPNWCKYGDIVSGGYNENGCSNPPICSKNLSNGRQAEIKIMPETASEKAIERLGQLNFTVELKEVGNNQTAYKLKAEREGKIFGLFRVMADVYVEVDAESGEVLRTRKPWWAFLASGI